VLPHAEFTVHDFLRFLVQMLLQTAVGVLHRQVSCSAFGSTCMQVTFTRMNARIQGTNTLSTRDELCSCDDGTGSTEAMGRERGGGVGRDNLLEKYILCEDDEDEAKGEAQLVPGHDVLWPGQLLAHVLGTGPSSLHCPFNLPRRVHSGSELVRCRPDKCAAQAAPLFRMFGEGGGRDLGANREERWW
jgi:hypothetical protein